jgi:hypothetical protein
VVSDFQPIPDYRAYDDTPKDTRCLNYTLKGSIQNLLVGHKVAKVAKDHLLLDDGTVLRFPDTYGGCSCNSGCYDLTELNGVDNIITAVEFQDDPGGDGYHEEGGGVYRIYVYADNQKINLATWEGTDGNGYYGTGYDIWVRRPEGAQ